MSTPELYIPEAGNPRAGEIRLTVGAGVAWMTPEQAVQATISLQSAIVKAEQARGRRTDPAPYSFIDEATRDRLERPALQDLPPVRTGSSTPDPVMEAARSFTPADHDWSDNDYVRGF